MSIGEEISQNLWIRLLQVFYSTPSNEKKLVKENILNGQTVGLFTCLFKRKKYHIFKELLLLLTKHIVNGVTILDLIIEIFQKYVTRLILILKIALTATATPKVRWYC